MSVSWEGGKPPATDVHGTPQFNNATGQSHSTTRAAEKVMRDYGFDPCGDKEHGGRDVHRIENKGFSYPSQRTHISSGERERART
jgi:hypothetical protein